ncbi:MAG: TnpV protein [Clostridia bacterium]|nr:TnpV protein [Clostridia bacterium]
MTRLTYRTVNGVQIPNLRLPKQKNYPLGKYAMMRHDFLEKHRKGTYTTLLTEFRLAEHLYETDVRAKEQITKITAEMAQSLGVNEQMKASDPMKWVQMMNSIKKTAEDTVLQELIYT